MGALVAGPFGLAVGLKAGLALGTTSAVAGGITEAVAGATIRKHVYDTGKRLADGTYAGNIAFHCITRRRRP